MPLGDCDSDHTILHYEVRVHDFCALDFVKTVDGVLALQPVVIDVLLGVLDLEEKDLLSLKERLDELVTGDLAVVVLVHALVKLHRNVAVELLAGLFIN